jgi:hypothetical protein
MKRGGDVAVACLGLLGLAPLLLAVVLLIQLDSPGPVEHLPDLDPQGFHRLSGAPTLRSISRSRWAQHSRRRQRGDQVKALQRSAAK